MPSRQVLLVGPVSGDGIVGGIENGIDMLLRSPIATRHGIVFFNSYRAPDPSRSWPRRIGCELGAIGRYVRCLVATRPRLVHVKTAEGVNFYQSIAYTSLARMSGARVLLQIHGGSFDTWYEGLSRGRRALVRLGLRVPHALMALSERWRECLRRLQPRTPVHVLPNAVELERARRERGTPGPILRVLTIGALGARKGHFDIVAAARLLRHEPIRFQFAGPDEFGGEADELRRRIAGDGLEQRVELLGAVTGDRKWELLGETDVFLLPSYNENMPNAVLEAMAAGLPIVCTAVGAVAEMVDAQGARFVPPGDPDAIAAALRDLLHAPGERAAMGRANRDRIETHYALERVLPVLEQLYSAA